MLPDDADAAALEQCAELLWQGWRFHETGARLYVLSEEAAARVTRPAYDMGDWRFAAPPACYVQLPYQRLWARVSAEEPYEPVDGWFMAARALSPRAHELALLAVLGLRQDRPGVSLLPHRATVAEGEEGARAGHPWREGAEPFANAIPGGERMGYRTLATASELEALALRTLREIERDPRALRRAEGGGGANASAFAHVLVP